MDLKHGTDAAFSGTFGVIDRHWYRSATPRWTQHLAVPTPNKTKNSPQLGEFMANMVAGVPLFGRDAAIQPNDPWSLMIEALLRQNQNKKFQHTPSLGRGTHPRSVTAISSMQGGVLSFRTFGGDGEPPEEVVILDEDPSGISMIHIEVYEDEREGRLGR